MILLSVAVLLVIWDIQEWIKDCNPVLLVLELFASLLGFFFWVMIFTFIWKEWIQVE